MKKVKDDLNSLESDNKSLCSESDETLNLEETLQRSNGIRNSDFEELEDRIFGRIIQYSSQETKMLLMLKRAYYLNELEKIERYLYHVNRLNLNKNEQKKLSLCFNRLSKLENLYICLEDYYRSLSLQKQILYNIKRCIINK